MSSHQFRGKSARRQRRRAGFSQASTRRGVTMYDQHGREWSAQIGNKSGRTVGQITPNFRAPWVPDQQYLKVNPDNTSELYIDYDAMILRRNARVEEFHKLAIDFAREKKLPLPTKKGEYSDQITRSLGGAPKPIQPMIAARQGNVYILGPDYAEANGLAYEVDPRLEPYVVKPRNEAILAEFDFSPASTFADVKARNELPAATDPGEDAGGDASDAADADPDAFDEMNALDAGSDGDVDAMLAQLEDEFDAEAVGGKRVAPKNTDRLARQAPRRAGSSTKKKPQSSREKQRARQRGNRPTLADGAAPVIAGSDL